MCGMCPDFVDSCREAECVLGSVTLTCPDGSTFERVHARHFFLGDTFCRHLAEEHSTDDASHYAHFAWDHTGDGCECVAGDWWGDRPSPVVEA